MAEERIARRLARAGLCSRREAERWIAAGRVAINGLVIDSPAFNVSDDAVITVNGTPIPAAQPPRMWRYHKPRGLIVSHADEQGRETVFDHLPAHMPRVISVGRLDLDSEGLLLLTNDGALARELEHPAQGWARDYRVRVRGRPDAGALKALAMGIEVEGMRYGPIKATVMRSSCANCWLSIRLHEGKNREVRRVMTHLGHPVSRLIRVGYGPFLLGDLPRSAVSEVCAEDIQSLPKRA